MTDIIKERAELIASKMREHFPHVHVMIQRDMPKVNWLRGDILTHIDEGDNLVNFIASDIPYKRSEYPNNVAMFSALDIMSEGILSDMPEIIATMQQHYAEGARKRN